MKQDMHEELSIRSALFLLSSHGVENSDLYTEVVTIYRDHQKAGGFFGARNAIRQAIHESGKDQALPRELISKLHVAV